MRIILFYPRGYPLQSPQSRVGHHAALLPPLGLASIAAVLRTRGHEVILMDAALHCTVTNEQWVKRIIQQHPDAVGFSCITPAFEDAAALCTLLKQHAPAILTIFGGVHVSWAGARALERYAAIDYVIAGEGEYALAQLLDGEPADTIAGLHYRSGGLIQSAPPQSKQTQCVMDELPFPAYDLLEGFPHRYNLPLFSYRHHPGTHIISSRGCVYQCSYCDRSVFGQSFRWNSPEYTFELVKYLRSDFGIRHLYFYDDLFTLNRARVEKLCTLLREARLGVGFNCIVRAGHIDEELLGMLRSAGCWMVNIGIESGDQAILDSHKEGLSLESIRSDVNRIYASGIHVKGLFMMGFPGESEASVRKTIDFACSLPLKDANITAFTPYPGAPIRKTIDNLGSFNEQWSLMDCEHFVFTPHSLPSRERLEQLYAEFIHRFYHRPFLRKLYRRMLWESPHSYWRLLCHLGSFLGYARHQRRANKLGEH